MMSEILQADEGLFLSIARISASLSLLKDKRRPKFGTARVSALVVRELELSSQVTACDSTPKRGPSLSRTGPAYLTFNNLRV